MGLVAADGGTNNAAGRADRVAGRDVFAWLHGLSLRQRLCATSGGSWIGPAGGAADASGFSILKHFLQVPVFIRA